MMILGNEQIIVDLVSPFDKDTYFKESCWLVAPNESTKSVMFAHRFFDFPGTGEASRERH